MNAAYRVVNLDRAKEHGLPLQTPSDIVGTAYALIASPQMERLDEADPVTRLGRKRAPYDVVACSWRSLTVALIKQDAQRLTLAAWHQDRKLKPETVVRYCQMTAYRQETVWYPFQSVLEIRADYEYIRVWKPKDHGLLISAPQSRDPQALRDATDLHRSVMKMLGGLPAGYSLNRPEEIWPSVLFIPPRITELRETPAIQPAPAA